MRALTSNGFWCPRYSSFAGVEPRREWRVTSVTPLVSEAELRRGGHPPTNLASGRAQSPTMILHPDQVEFRRGRPQSALRSRSPIATNGCRPLGSVERVACRPPSSVGGCVRLAPFLRCQSACQAVFSTTPSGRASWVAYFHSAMRSLRARATISTFFMRPWPSARRLLNQCASALPG